MFDWLKKTWCSWLHGGGDIHRDDQGRINWKCHKCGRWSDHPVPIEEEKRVVEREMRAPAMPNEIMAWPSDVSPPTTLATVMRQAITAKKGRRT